MRRGFYQRILILGAAVVLSGCMTYDFSRPVLQQGNLLSASVVERLKLGMSKQEVETLLGSSLFSPIWTGNRWDYIYMRRLGAQPLKKRHLSLYFEQERLVKITKD
ncbi:MAG: outer membrane protein assembly factor BamE [Legionella sp.]|nr:outer membrane protein assembly factor BamE [Legionella sp.]